MNDLWQGDQWLFVRIHKGLNEWASWIYELMIPLGSKPVVAGFLGLMIMMVCVLHRPRFTALYSGVQIMIIAFCAYGSSVLVKPMIARIRPCHFPYLSETWVFDMCATSFSMPSNHSVFFSACAVACFWYLKRSWIWLIMSLFAVVVGLSRVVLGVHYPADVGVGWIWGLSVGWSLSCLMTYATNYLNIRSTPSDGGDS